MRNTNKRISGFTLIEMMVVVLIIGVLASIAYASYQHFVVKSRRGAATSCLQERAQFMERYYTTNMTYVDAPAPPACDASISTFYTVSFNGTPAAGTFSLQAVPQGQQATLDTLCATLSVNQQGVRSASGSASATPDSCW